MEKEKFIDALKKAFEDKGKKKFTQSIEIIINTRGIDFSKSENRLNIDIPLPKGKGGKELKAAVIAEADLADKAKKAGAQLIISPQEIPSYADSKRLKVLAREYFLLSQPNLMGQVAKSFGQYLGKRGKLPRPIIGDVGELIERSKRSIRITTKGKYLPVIQAFIGTEKMPVEDVAENAEAVYEAVKDKIGGEGNIKSVYVKLTMGKAIRVR